jgi:hypothetical protein
MERGWIWPDYAVSNSLRAASANPTSALNNEIEELAKLGLDIARSAPARCSATTSASTTSSNQPFHSFEVDDYIVSSQRVHALLPKVETLTRNLKFGEATEILHLERCGDSALPKT